MDLKKKQRNQSGHVHMPLLICDSCSFLMSPERARRNKSQQGGGGSLRERAESTGTAQVRKGHSPAPCEASGARVRTTERGHRRLPEATKATAGGPRIPPAA